MVKKDEEYILWKEGNKEKLLMFQQYWKCCLTLQIFPSSPHREEGSDLAQSVSSGFIICEEGLEDSWLESSQTTLLTQAAY